MQCRYYIGKGDHVLSNIILVAYNSPTYPILAAMLLISSNYQSNYSNMYLGLLYFHRVLYRKAMQWLDCCVCMNFKPLKPHSSHRMAISLSSSLFPSLTDKGHGLFLYNDNIFKKYVIDFFNKRGLIGERSQGEAFFLTTLFWDSFPKESKKSNRSILS